MIIKCQKGDRVLEENRLPLAIRENHTVWPARYDAVTSVRIHWSGSIPGAFSFLRGNAKTCPECLSVERLEDQDSSATNLGVFHVFSTT